MLKKIREEKTFNTSKKAGIQEALNSLEAIEENKNELEEQWINELIRRKKEDIENSPEEEQIEPH